MSLSCCVRRPNHMRSSSTEQAWARRKKIMPRGIAGTVPSAEKGSKNEPCGDVQLPFDGRGCIFRTLRAHSVANRCHTP